MLGSILAYLSLTYVIQTASLRALFARPTTWQRTTKFRSGHHRRTAIASARNETAAGLTAIACAAVGLIALPHQGVAMMLFIGTGIIGTIYLTAPIVALIADHDLKRQAKRTRTNDTTIYLTNR